MASFLVQDSLVHCEEMIYDNLLSQIGMCSKIVYKGMLYRYNVCIYRLYFAKIVVLQCQELPLAVAGTNHLLKAGR